MARYELRFKASVAKDLRGLPDADVRHILERIESLGLKQAVRETLNKSCIVIASV